MKSYQAMNKIIESGFYALVFFTPLLFNPSRVFPSSELFEWNKMMFIYGMTTIITGAWVVKMILFRKILFKRTPFDLPLILFLLSQILSTIFSIDHHVSVFGYYSRFHGGLLSTISYVLLFYALVSNSEVVNFTKLIGFVFSSAVVVTVYGILEKFGIDAHMWVQDVRFRVFSTLGQPNWLAAYLTILLPITISIGLINLTKSIGLLKDKGQSSKLKAKSQNLKFKNPFFVICYLSLATLFYLCLLFTKSRSGFLGFWVANAFFWIGIFWLFKNKIKKIFPIFLIFNFVFLIFNFVFVTPFPDYNRIATREIFQPSPTIEESIPVSGDSIINIGITDSSTIRQIVWKGAVEIIKNYPLFGTGPETFAFAYYKFRPIEHNLTSEWDFIYNRAHNELLNIAATSGIFGLTMYLLLVISVVIFSIKIILDPKMPLKYKIVSLSLLTAYLSVQITNFFGFSVAVIGIFFFLMPAYLYIFRVKVSAEYPQSIQKPITNLANVSTRQKLLLGLWIVLPAVLIWNLIQFWLADMYYAKAKSIASQEDAMQAHNYIVTATNLRPDEPVYHDERAVITNNLAQLAFANNDSTQGAKLVQDALFQSTYALKISPQNLNFWKTRTKIYFQLSQYDQTFINSALDSILITQKLAPTDPKIAYNVAVIYGHAGKNKEAIQTLQKTIELKPDYKDAYIALAIFYQQENQIDKARQILEQALQRINLDDQEIKQRLETL